MKRQKGKGVVIIPVRKGINGFMTAPPIHIGVDEVPEGRNQYIQAKSLAKKKSGLSRFKSWTFL